MRVRARHNGTVVTRGGPRHTGNGRAARVIGYVRVSTEEQADLGVSIDAQEHRLRAYGEAHGLHVVRIERDRGLSGKRTANRPALLRALRSLARGEADGLAVCKLDRLSRSTRDVLDLAARANREGWQLHSLAERLDTSSPTGRFTLTLLAALAELEREQIGERTRDAMAELARQGRRVSGRPPFGFRHEDGRLVPARREKEQLARILELRAGGLGARRIAAALNEEGIGNPRTGKPWTASTMAAVLRTAAKRAGGARQQTLNVRGTLAR